MSIEPITALVTDVSATSPANSGNQFERFLREVDRTQTEEPTSLRAWLDLAEAWKIRQALDQCRGNRSAAARALGIGRRTLYAKMEKLEITPSWRGGDR